MAEDPIKVLEEKRQAKIAECERSSGHGNTYVNKWGDTECLGCGVTLVRTDPLYPRGNAVLYINSESRKK